MNILKNITLIFILLLLISGISFSQPNGDKKKFKEEINKIMKVKLIDSVGMDEATAEKFLNLYRSHNKEIRSLSKDKRELMKSIETDPGAPDINTKFDKMLDIETSILEKRKNFLMELKAFLTPQQIAKTLILRKKIGREIRKEVMKHRKDDKFREN